MPALTLTVCTRNDLEDLQGLLRTVPAQPTGPDRIIICEAGDADALREAVASLAPVGVAVEVLAQDLQRPGIASARNQAIDAAPDGWVIIADADFRFSDAAVWDEIRRHPSDHCIAPVRLTATSCLGRAYCAEFPRTRYLAFQKRSGHPWFQEGLGTGEDQLFWGHFRPQWPEPPADLTTWIEMGIPDTAAAIVAQQAWYGRTRPAFMAALPPRRRMAERARAWLDSARIGAPPPLAIAGAAASLVVGWPALLACIPLAAVVVSKTLRGRIRLGYWTNPLCAMAAEQARLWGRIVGFWQARSS